MLNFVKKAVAGPKKTTEFNGAHLDLTHISPRIIAMAFPACSLLEQFYRNSISDVANYLQTHHPNNFLVLNVSNRLYDYSKLQDRVKDYTWADHQAPPLSTLIHIAFDMYHFLDSNTPHIQPTPTE